MSAPKEQGDAPNRRSRSRREQSDPAASVNMEEMRELITLMINNGLAELELEREDFRVRLRRDSVPAATAQYTQIPAPAPAPAPVLDPVPAPAPPSAPSHPATQATATSSTQDQDVHIIPSPIVGTFYRSPSPNAEPFIKIGSNVEHDTVVCIIEAMKLMNEIQAEASGEVVKIYVENGQPVEYGQPLFGIKPQ
jgi:acetyl-CoA carboxylase biotin carboxyl carrier protein